MNSCQAALALILISVTAFADPASEKVSNAIALVSDTMQEHPNGKLAEHLQSSGMSPEDAAAIELQSLQDAAFCYVNSIVQVAEDSSISVDTVLDALETSIKETNLITVGSILDEEIVTEKAMPCLYDIGERAGVDVSSDAD